MSSNTISEIITHMEFLGYEMEKREDGNYIARHDSYGTTFVKPYHGGALFQQYWVLNNYTSDKRSSCLDAINEINSNANVTTYVVNIDSEGDALLRMDSCYLGVYDKKLFGNYLELYNTDTRNRVAQNETLVSLIE